MMTLEILNRAWRDCTFVAFDTETSGGYPLGADIVEFGAVKWRDGKIVDEFQTLLKPAFEIPKYIIDVHGITNEMVATAPPMKEKILDIQEFIKDAVLLAHHAPFDMGFLAVDFEKFKMPMPTNVVICTSLLSRNIIKESPNHKLQTLIKFLNLHQGSAHRAKDDAQACLEVALACFRRVGDAALVGEIVKKMGKSLVWEKYSLLNNNNEIYQTFVQAIQSKSDMDIIYEGGSLKGKTRRISPIGIVRNPDGDYVMALCHVDKAQKRFYLNKIRDVSIVYKGSD